MRREVKVASVLVLLLVLFSMMGCASMQAPKATAVVAYEEVGKQITYAATQWRGLKDQGLATPAQDATFKSIYKKAYDAYQMAGTLQKQVILAKTQVEADGFKATYDRLIDQVLTAVTDMLMLASSFQTPPTGGK